MIELRPLSDKNEMLCFYKKAELEVNEYSGCVKAADKGDVLGFCLYDLTQQRITIRYIEPLDDLGLADGILRSTLHVAAEKSIMNAFYADTVPEDFFKKLNFIKDESEKSLNIDKLFQSCCNCG